MATTSAPPGVALHGWGVYYRSMTNTETLESLKAHYTDAVNRGDSNRAMDIAAAYRRITERHISEDLDTTVEGWKDHYNQRFAEMMAIPADELI